ncbi:MULTISPECIES: hypothetical protein [unclassified Minwuia]|jgi:hypothetical protein|uniref:hypothetical protein n=1 Tax=unclassified Minwuia TaxID=2618799 RepID=UPI002478D7C8|nr:MULTISPECIES: hypothetical protein [unclassified Minwuia]
MSTLRIRRFLIAVTFCVTFCGAAMSALGPFAVEPVAPAAEQDQSLALVEARSHCIQSLASAVEAQTELTASEAREVAGERCELMFMSDPISKLTDNSEKT